MARPRVVLSEKPRTTAYGKKRPRLCAYLHEHNAHGLVYAEPFWMPKGEKPEVGGEYIRAPWLDEPKRKPRK